MLALFFLLTLAAAVQLQGRRYPSRNFNTDELIVITCPLLIEVQVGTETYKFPPNTQEIAIIASSFDVVTIPDLSPDEGCIDVTRTIITLTEKELLHRGTSDDCEIELSEEGGADRLILSGHRFVAPTKCVKFSDLDGGHVHAYNAAASTVTKMTLAQSFSIFKMTPQILEMSGYVQIYRPLISPCIPPELLKVYVDVYILSVSTPSTYVETLSIPPDQPAVLLSLADQSNTYAFNISIVTLGGAVLHRLSTTVSEGYPPLNGVFGGLSYVAGEIQMPPPLTVTPTPLIAAIELEHDQVMPRSEDDHPAFVRAFIVNQKILSGGSILQVVVQINTDYFLVEEPEYVFTAWFGIDYYVKFYVQTTLGAFYESSMAVLKAPQPVFFVILNPVIRDQYGVVRMNVSTNLDEFTVDDAFVGTAENETSRLIIQTWRPTLTIRYGGDSIITQQMPPVELIITKETPPVDYACSPTPTLRSNPAAEISELPPLKAVISGDWRGELTHEQLCAGLVVFSVPLSVAFRVHHIHSEFDITLHESMFRVVAPFYTAEAAIEIIPAAGGVQRGTVKGRVIFPSMASYGTRVGIDFTPPRILSVMPQRSSSSRGRIVMSGGVNLTSFEGAVVDPMSLDQGVYMATTTRVFDDIVCIHNQLVTVPPLIPSKLVEVRISPPPVCPRSLVTNKNQPMYQLSITPPSERVDGILWEEETNRKQKIPPSGAMSVYSPGRFQVIYTDTLQMAYSRLFELKEVGWDESDFDFTRYSPRPSEETKCGQPMDDPMLTFPPHLEDKVEVAVIECKPECPLLKIERPEAGMVVFKGLPFISTLRVEVTISDSCRFITQTHLLPSPDKLPPSIAEVEYAPTCGGGLRDEDWHPLYVDPFSGEPKRISDELFDIEVSVDHFEDKIEIHTSVHSDDGCAIEGVFYVPAEMIYVPPRLSVERVNPIFCPNVADASILLGLDFNNGDDIILDHVLSGTMISRDISRKGALRLDSVGFGHHTFMLHASNPTYDLHCIVEATVRVAEKKHFNVEAHIKGLIEDLGTFESTLLLMVHDEHSQERAPEFSKFTADMLSPADRSYLEDRGFGSDALRRVPNGHVIDIMIPYPESYAHIRDDFCPEKLHLTLGTRATPIDKTVLNVQSLYPVYHSEAATLKDRGECQPVIGVMKRRIYAVESEPISTTTPFADFGGVRRYNIHPQPLNNVIISLQCIVTRIPSCPSCHDGIITSQNGAMGTYYVWSDLGTVLSTNVRTGVGVGTYFLAVIEPSHNVYLEGAPKCVVTVSETVTPFIESVNTALPMGCLGSTTVRITIIVGNNPPSGGVSGGVWLTDYDPPIVACDDPRLVAVVGGNLVAVEGLPLMSYSTAICDGGAILTGAVVQTPGPDNTPMAVDVVSSGELCFSPIGIVPVSPPTLALSTELIVGSINVLPYYIPFSTVASGSSTNIIFGGYDILGPMTLRVSDARQCMTFVTVNPSVIVCSNNITALAESGELDPAPYDCIITFNETVPEAVIEIEYCVANNQPVLGSDAPIISLPVVLAATPTMTMEFLQFNSTIYVPGTFGYLQNVNVGGWNSSIAVAATVASLSNCVFNTTILLPGNVNVGGVVPNQQITFQYGALDGSLLVIEPGISSLQVFIAHLVVGPLSVNVTRTGANMQLIQSSVALLNLYQINIQTFLGLSNDGSSPISLLRVFVMGVNATSNSTMQVVCHYILNYPAIVLTAQAGNNGTLVTTSDQCIDFGTVVTPSNSQSMNKFPIYKQQTELPQSLFLFAFVIVFVVIMGIMIVFIRGIEQ
jgi:hypothetical protein